MRRLPRWLVPLLVPVLLLPLLAASCGPQLTAVTKVVVIMEENRTWSDVGQGFSTMPWLSQQGGAYLPAWNDTNPNQNSLTQYIGLTSGVNNPATVNDCNPSASCRSTDNNIFRQARTASNPSMSARSWVEGATTGCSASGNAAKHVPALYYFGSYFGTDDHANCASEVRPLSELNLSAIPDGFNLITPNLCNDGHDSGCTNATVDNWLHVVLGAILASQDYKDGKVFVQIQWDEERPVPNLALHPSIPAGARTGITGSHNDALATWEDLLGLGNLGGGTSLVSTYQNP